MKKYLGREAIIIVVAVLVSNRAYASFRIRPKHETTGNLFGINLATGPIEYDELPAAPAHHGVGHHHDDGGHHRGGGHYHHI